MKETSHGCNQKELVYFNHLTKKDSFYLYRIVWFKELFEYLFGSCYTDRNEILQKILMKVLLQNLYKQTVGQKESPKETVKQLQKKHKGIQVKKQV